MVSVFAGTNRLFQITDIDCQQLLFIFDALYMGNCGKVKIVLQRQVFDWKDIMLDFFKGWFEMVQEVNILVNFQVIQSWTQLKYVILRVELNK